MGYACRFDAMLCKEVGFDLVVGVDVPITTVCPCSKEISVAGAHNQRAWLRVKLRTVPGRFLWFEEPARQRIRKWFAARRAKARPVAATMEPPPRLPFSAS